MTAPWRRDFETARDPYAARNALGITSTGGGGGVPTTRTITAGAGLTGGGDLSADRTIDVGAGTGITVNANDVALTVPVSVANGGTGSSTGGGALTNLGAQPLDTTLTALAAYNTNGLLTQTAADTFTGRSIAVPAAGISITNANGVAGNPTLALANDLAALEALGGTNTIYYRSGSDAWSAVTIGTNLTFAGGTLAASGGAVSAASVPHEGRLTYVSSTALKFAPYAGNQIKINGAIYTIPNAGIAGLGNTGVFVNGTGGQNLATGTTYWVFAFNNSGTITADFRTGAVHSTSTTAGNEGVEILTGSDTRTLIGLVRTTTGTPNFIDIPAARFVASWFNRRPVSLVGAATGDITTSSTTPVELNVNGRVEFICWSDAAVTVHSATHGYNATTAGGQLWHNAGIDGSSTMIGQSISTAQTAAGGYFMNMSLSGSFSASESYHYVTPFGWMGAGTGHFFSILSGTVLI